MEDCLLQEEMKKWGWFAGRGAVHAMQVVGTVLIFLDGEFPDDRFLDGSSEEKFLGEVLLAVVLNSLLLIGVARFLPWEFRGWRGNPFNIPGIFHLVVSIVFVEALLAVVLQWGVDQTLNREGVGHLVVTAVYLVLIPRVF